MMLLYWPKEAASTIFASKLLMSWIIFLFIVLCYHTNIMPQDKYSAVWVSHSSMGDFIKCPRAYFLHNVYRNASGRKINIVNPHLSLGIAVHETLEGLLNYKAEERFAKPLMATFEENWKK